MSSSMLEIDQYLDVMNSDRLQIEEEFKGQ